VHIRALGGGSLIVCLGHFRPRVAGYGTTKGRCVWDAAKNSEEDLERLFEHPDLQRGIIMSDYEGTAVCFCSPVSKGNLKTVHRLR
jgi:hypothetical protein